MNVLESWWSPICVQGQRVALSKPFFTISFSSAQGRFFMFSLVALGSAGSSVAQHLIWLGQ